MTTKAFLIVVAVMLMALMPLAASAQEPAGTVVGPYIVQVDVSPDPPTIRGVLVAVTVVDAASGEPIDDADVRILTVNREDGVLGDTPARSNSVFPGYYRAPISPEPGTWSLQVAIASELGEVVVDQPDLVIPQYKAPLAGTVIYAVVVASIIGVASYLWWTSRRARQRRAAATGATQ
jgi:Flp pilus assembly protein CpaB